MGTKKDNAKSLQDKPVMKIHGTPTIIDIKKLIKDLIKMVAIVPTRVLGEGSMDMKYYCLRK